MAGTTNVVIGDFDRNRVEELATELASRGLKVTVALTGTDVLDLCLKAPPHFVVLEVFLPKKNGFEVLKALKADSRAAETHVVVLLDEGDDYGEHRARLCGADTLLKRPLTTERLVDILRLAHGSRSEDSASPRAAGELGSVLNALQGRSQVENPLIAAITDELTGLYNRSYMDLKFGEEIKKARRFGHPLSCIVLSLDDHPNIVEPINGQEMRRALNEVAGILLCESRDIDHLGRYLEREFIMLLPHTEATGATTMAKRILSSIEARGFEFNSQTLTLTGSSGIAGLQESGIERAEEFYARAKEALLVSRRWGGNRSTLWEKDAERMKRN